MNNLDKHLHPLERANALDSRFRRLLQNPRKILNKYIQPGMTVLDLGCGTGYFTLELAKLIGNTGRVVALDVQNGMLNILRQKTQKSEQEKQIQIMRNSESSLGLTEKFDFILAFYSFHEMKYLDAIIDELSKIVKSGTKILISEQKFHVSKSFFESMINKMQNSGFEIIEKPKIFLSRTVIMKPNKEYNQ